MNYRKRRPIEERINFIYGKLQRLTHLRREFQLRKIGIPQITEIIFTEDSSEHWKYFKVEGRNVLDLGCGRWYHPNIKESSPVYFKAAGATKVIGVDAKEQEINFYKDYFKKNIKDESEFILKYIRKPADIVSLIERFEITALKSDIEGSEIHLFKLSAQELKTIHSISIEYHSPLLLRELIHVNNTEWHYNIVNHSIFTLHPEMGVVTLEKTT